ncbi:MAG TPA: hypothetical protein V6C65_22420 [Allocoleopsis sp.]
MQLIYRGFTYNAQPATPAKTLQPRVINWRYRVTGNVYEPTLIAATEPRHPVINWRYQLAAMA